MSLYSRQIFQDLLFRKPTDRLAIHENFWADTLPVWQKQGYPASSEPDARLLVDLFDIPDHIPESPIDYFGIDDWKITNWLDVFPRKGFKKVISENDEWITFENGAGAIVRQFKHKTGVMEHIDFTMTSREIWQEQYKPYLLGAVDVDRICLDKVRAQYAHARKHDKCVFYCTEFIWETMRRCLGDLCMYTSLIDDPDWILDFNRTYTDFYLKYFQYLFDTVGVPDGGWIFEDIAYANGLFCSAEMLEEFFFPFYKEIADFFHSYGIPIVFHSCGKINDAIPLIIDAGFDALNPLQAKAGVDALEIARKYGDKLAFIGGFDAHLFESGDKAAIEAEMLRLMEGMKALGASYIFSSDHSISPLVPLETYQFAVDVFKAHMRRQN